MLRSLLPMCSSSTEPRLLYQVFGSSAKTVSFPGDSGCCASEQSLYFCLCQSLFLYQLLGELVQGLTVTAHDLPGTVVGSVDDAADLDVNLAGY